MLTPHNLFDTPRYPQISYGGEGEDLILAAGCDMDAFDGVKRSN